MHQYFLPLFLMLQTYSVYLCPWWHRQSDVWTPHYIVSYPPPGQFQYKDAVSAPSYLYSGNHYNWTDSLYINSLRPRPNRRHFADDIFKCIFENENEWISPRISPKFVPKVRINNIPALVQIMAWRRPGDKPLSEPMMVNLPTHICVSRLQLVKASPCPLQSLVVSWLWVQAVDLTIDWPMKIDQSLSHKLTLHLTNIPQCTILYITEMHTRAHFCYNMVHCGIWDWCIVGL